MLTIEKVQASKPRQPVSLGSRPFFTSHNLPRLSFRATRLGDILDTQARRVARKDTAAARLAVQKAEKIALDLDGFDDRFDDQVGRGDRLAAEEGILSIICFLTVHE